MLAGRLGVPEPEVSALDDGTVGRIAGAVRSRRVLIVPASRPEEARSALAGLSAVLAGLRDLGLRGDGLVWVTSCDGVEPEITTALLELGQATGTGVLLSTTSITCAASLAAIVGTTVECGLTHGTRTFTLTSADHPDGRVSGVLVPIALAETR
jgi:hypothetical protein